MLPFEFGIAGHQSAISNSNGINRDRKTLTYRKL
jgi:hypothetical protein